MKPQVVKIGAGSAREVMNDILKQLKEEYYSGVIERVRIGYSVLISYAVYIDEREIQKEFEFMVVFADKEMPAILRTREFYNEINILLWNYQNGTYESLKGGERNIVKSTRMKSIAMSYYMTLN